MSIRDRPLPAAVASGLPEDLLARLRCLQCGGPVGLPALSKRSGYPELGPDGYLSCTCGERYPLIAGTVRMLPRTRRPPLWDRYPLSAEVLEWAGVPRPPALRSARVDVRQRTADSFAYEWERFGGLRAEWRQNFIDYMQPHAPETFAGRYVLDVGAGSGRHAFHASACGARVVAVDLGASIDVARANLPADVLTVQADAERLPLAPEAFDFVMSIGVLHHLPDPRSGLQSIVRYARPGGTVHVYLYWTPEVRWHALVLGWVRRARQVTVRMPHRLLHALCYPLAAALAAAFVWPYRLLRNVPALNRLAAGLPLKTYADYPFGVLVNDQFDRFSAPLEQRYTRAEVAALLEEVGLRDVQVIPNHGWVGDGRRDLA